MGTKQTIEGTVRTVENLQREKKDLDVESGKLVIMNEDGERIDIKGGPGVTDGFRPEMKVKVTIERLDQTIAEATAEKKQ